MINTVVAPGLATDAETFLWYDANPRLKLGIAHLAKQGAFRVLGSYQLCPETDSKPSFHIGAGVQGIGTGNPGFSARAEKSFDTELGHVNTYVGLGLRSNENHSHGLAGVKLRLPSGFGVGVQMDGHQTNPFATYSEGQWTVGLFLIEGKNAAYMVGARF